MCIRDSKEEVRKTAESDETIETFLLRYVESEQYNETRKKLEDFITGRILDGLDKMDVGKVIAEEGAKEVKKKFEDVYKRQILLLRYIT